MNYRDEKPKPASSWIMNSRHAISCTHHSSCDRSVILPLSGNNRDIVGVAVAPPILSRRINVHPRAEYRSAVRRSTCTKLYRQIGTTLRRISWHLYYSQGLSEESLDHESSCPCQLQRRRRNVDSQYREMWVRGRVRTIE